MAKYRPREKRHFKHYFDGVRRRPPLGGARPTARQRRQMEAALSQVTGKIVNIGRGAASAVWGAITGRTGGNPTRREIQQAAEDLVPAELVDDEVFTAELVEDEIYPAELVDDVYPAELVEDSPAGGRRSPQLPSPPQGGRVSPPGGRTAPELSLDEDLVEPEKIGYTFFAPESTNVYSYRYDHLNKNLYVTYRVYRKIERGSDQRPNEPGVTYQYFNVPVAVWHQFRNKARSDRRGGEEVWDHLRQRGTIFGTQYHYSLVEPQESGGRTYVPRRATRKGLKRRAVIDIRNTRRGQPIWVESTLPNQDFGGRRGRNSRRRNRG